MFTETTHPAIDFRNFDPRLKEIIAAEPRLQAVFDQAMKQNPGPGYDRILTYLRLKNQISKLVGWYAAHPDLRNSGDYQLVIEVVINLLPPDHIDLLYPPPRPYRR